jgi:hypothetical protein
MFTLPKGIETLAASIEEGGRQARLPRLEFEESFAKMVYNATISCKVRGRELAHADHMPKLSEAVRKGGMAGAESSSPLVSTWFSAVDLSAPLFIRQLPESL